MHTQKVAIAGLGAIGWKVAQALDQARVPGLSLSAVAVRDPVRAREKIAGFVTPPLIAELAILPQLADVVVECIPAAHFRVIAEATIEAGKVLVPLSVGQLLSNMDLIERAKQTGARILVPTGALLGLDAVRAVAEGQIESVKIVTRKPPAGLRGAPALAECAISMEGLLAPALVFSGSAREAIKGFPANVNVAVALSLAGIGPDKTEVEIWADPSVSRNTHTIHVLSDSSDLTMTIANIPSEETPATGKITALSVIAALRRLTAPLVVGS